MSLFGILVRTFLGLGTPAAGPGTAPVPAHFVPSVPLVATPAATPASAADIVDKVQGFYAGIKQVTSLFRQSVTNDTFGSTKTSDGTVWIMKPGKMRWDYVEKKKTEVVVKKSFISNGTYL